MAKAVETKVTDHRVELDSDSTRTRVDEDPQGTHNEDSLRDVGKPHRRFTTDDRIDHFVLIRKLGEGGFGQVWLANDTRLHRQVAIKLPHRSFRSDSQEAKRFYREAETAAQLTHPNLVPILDAVLQDEQSYIVSEYCPGPTLMRWINDKPQLPLPKMAVSIVSQLASGLNVAHQLGLIHRDIKPSNIILSEADTDHPIPRLTDFGLSRAMSDVSETRTGALVGSGPYMSPEQASGNIDQHGPHSDVHALGVLLYELLTGQSPFASDNEMDTLRRIINLDPPSIRDCRPAVSRDISAVCQRCLEKDPSRRYRDAGELLVDLRRVLDGQPPLARPVGRFGRLTRWASRNVAIASMAAVAMVGIVLGIVGLAAYAFQSQRYARRSQTQSQNLREALDILKVQRAVAIEQRTEAFNQRNAAQSNFMRWRRTSYTSDISAAFLRFNQGYLGDVRRLLDRQCPATGEADLRTIEWWILDQQTQQSYTLYGQHANGANDCRLLNDEQTLLTLGGDGQVIFWDTVTGKPVKHLGGFGDRLTAIAFLPNGDLVLPGADWPWLGRSVCIVDPTTGRTKDVLHGHATTIDSIETSDDGNVIASAARYESIRVWFPQQRRSVTIENGLRNETFAMTSDGRRVITSQRNEDNLQVFDTETGAVIDQVDLDVSVVRTVCAHNHPWVGYTGYYAHGFGLANANDLSQRRWVPSGAQSRAIRFSKNDRYLAVSDRRGNVELFELDPDPSESGAEGLPAIESRGFLAGLWGNAHDIVVNQIGDVYSVSTNGSVERFSPLRREFLENIHRLPTAAQVVLSGDGKSAFSVSHQGDLFSSELPPKFAIARSSDAGVDTAHEPMLESLGKIGAVAFAPNHSRIAVILPNNDLYVYKTEQVDHRWRPVMDTQRHFQVRRLGDSEIRCKVELSSSGRYVAATTDDNCVSVFDLQRSDSDPICFRSFENVQSYLQFSPDETALISSGFSGVEILDIQTNRTRFHDPNLTNARSIIFGHDTERVFVGTNEGTILCLDLATGKTLFTLHGLDSDGHHSPEVAALAFYCDDRLALLTDSGEVQFWDLDQQMQLGSFRVCHRKESLVDFRSIQWLPEIGQLAILVADASETKLIRWSVSDEFRSLPITAVPSPVVSH